ncbi:MAG TPA: alpha/beta hydrolase [Allosphingosinicella sp.]|jgi:pimeloyl-ACP methyl ester carboxylesterase|uniref:alpha/beta fold hydrolase n=1 Tax=Allosphingosinicella sp. TaxID=2823234 RepID=UPI002F29A6DF
MPYFEARDGTEIYVKDWGHEGGRPVVLIHGWPLSSDSWDDVAVPLADAGYRVLAYDRRGFGRSDQPWEGYDYDTFADDLADVLESAEIEGGAALVGFSMGGGEVARYMSRHGGQGVTQAVLIGSVVPYLLKGDDNPNGADASVFEGIKVGIRKDRPDFFRSFFKAFFGVGVISHPVSDATLDWAWRLAMQAGLKGTLDCVDAFGTTDFRPDLASFTVPTLVIHGTADATVPIDASARAAAAGIKGARLIEYDGAPHGLFATHKDRLTQDLLEFLRSGTATV